ncbi:MAG: SPFH domain-containing protein [Nitrospinae bacterium]|nr:SPFH domain-containing protein [Nitrospinota bacterium]
MKRSFTLFLLFLCLQMFSACHAVSIDPGEEAVLTDRPYFFGHGGVKPVPVGTGLTWAWWTTDATLVDIKPVQYDEEFSDMMSKDNVPVHFNVYIKTKVLNSPMLVENFGPNWYAMNVKEPFRTVVRNLCKKYDMNQLVSSTEANMAMAEEAKKEIIDLIKTTGIPVEVLTVTVGRIIPTQEVMTAITATATQQQLQNTERQRALAQEIRKNAETKRAQADNAYRQAMGLSPDLFVKLEGIKAFSGAVEECAKSKSCTLMIIPPNVTPTVQAGK